MVNNIYSMNNDGVIKKRFDENVVTIMFSDNNGKSLHVTKIHMMPHRQDEFINHCSTLIGDYLTEFEDK